jgi:acetyl-CoA C-acetyltransferase
MGITAENLAEQYGITREEQDEMALLSNARALDAIDNGRFAEEIVPVEHVTRKESIELKIDEHPRRGSTLDALARLKPSFKDGGTVTAGNASGINDGSAGVILMSQSKANELGIPVLATLLSTATTGVEPEIMGIGPVSACRKAMDKAGLTLSDIELVEINEAFAAQYLACEKALGLKREITNVNGSGIGLGHPVGATGARILTTLIYEMRRRGLKTGMASLCAGGGMGTAMVIGM